MMKKIDQAIITLLLLGLNLLVSSALAVQEDTGNSEADDGLDAAQKLVAEEVRKEIDTICRVEVAMEIERYKKFFELDEEMTSQLKAVGEQIVESHVEKYTDEKILETWGQVGQAIGFGPVSTGVVINGRTCWFEENDDVNEESLPRVSMCLFRTSMLFMLAFDSGTTTTYMQYQIKFTPTESKLWKDALSSLSDEDIARYHEHRDEVKRQKAIDLVVASLSVQLKLTDDQIEPTRQWIRESMGDEKLAQKEVYGVAKMGFAKLTEPPECYSEEQKRVLMGIKAMFGR